MGFHSLKRDSSPFAFVCVPLLWFASWQRRSPGSISPGWSRGRTSCRIRNTALLQACDTGMFPAPCPLAVPQYGTTCTAGSRKCSGRRHIPLHHPGQDSCRHRSCSRREPSAAFCGTAGSPSREWGYLALFSSCTMETSL